MYPFYLGWLTAKARRTPRKMIFSESEPAVAFGYGEASGRFEKDSSPAGNQRILQVRSSSSASGALLSDLSGRLVGSKPEGRSPKLAERSLKLIGFFLLPIFASARENLAFLAPEQSPAGRDRRAVQASLLSHWRLVKKTFQL